MKIISWNVQGAKKPQVLQELKLLSSIHKPDILFLLETMVNEENINKLLPKLGYDHYDYVLPANHVGGIAVLWNDGNIHASVLIKEPRAIHMLIHDVRIAHNCVISGVYAPAQEREKPPFWEHLLELNSVIDIPWCLVGDFSELAAPNEKLGGQTLPLRRYDRLSSFMQTINADSIQVNGRLFTWKKRIHTHLVYERLDRAIARFDWTSHYPETIETHASFTCSDHCPIILSTETQRHSRKAFPFRFQNFWVNYQQVENIIKKKWRTNVSGTNMFQFAKKLRFIKHDIKEWSKQQFGNYHRKVSQNGQKIEYVESRLLNNPNSLRLNSWMYRLLKQREKLLLYNQKY